MIFDLKKLTKREGFKVFREMTELDHNGSPTEGLKSFHLLKLSLVG